MEETRLQKTKHIPRKSKFPNKFRTALKKHCDMDICMSYNVSQDCGKYVSAFRTELAELCTTCTTWGNFIIDLQMFGNASIAVNSAHTYG